MIGYLTKDKEGYKLHDSFGAFSMKIQKLGNLVILT